MPGIVIQVIHKIACGVIGRILFYLKQVEQSSSPKEVRGFSSSGFADDNLFVILWQGLWEFFSFHVYALFYPPVFLWTWICCNCSKQMSKLNILGYFLNSIFWWHGFLLVLVINNDTRRGLALLKEPPLQMCCQSFSGLIAPAGISPRRRNPEEAL